MAKGVFTFRITSEGVDELRAKLEALGPSGTKAFEALKQLSPQLKSGFEAAGKSADAARAQIAGLPKGLAALGESFNKAESATKAANRGLSDVVGTFQLFGSATGAVGSQLSGISQIVGNVSDLFGTLGNILGRHPLLAIGSVVSLAATAFVTFRGASVDAAKAQEQLQSALEKANALLLSQAQLADIALEKARGAALGALDAALPDVGQQAAKAERDLVRLEAAAERQRAARDKFSGRDFDKPAAQAARAASARAEAELAEKRVELNRLLIQRDTLNDPTKFAQRELLFPGQGATQFKTGAHREDLPEAEAVERLRTQAKEINEITGQAIERSKAAAAEAIKAAKAAMEEWERFEQRNEQLVERVVTEHHKRNESVNKYITKLEEESRLSGETNQEREIGRALYEAQSKLIDEMGEKVRDLTEAERARITVAVKTKDALENQAKAAEKVKQEVDRAAARSTDRIVDFAGDALFDRLTGKVTNFWDTFRQLGQRALAQVAAEMVFRPIIAPVVSAAKAAAPSLFGAQGAPAATGDASGGGLGGIVSSPISSLFSTGGSLISSAFGGSGGLLQGIGSTVGSLFGLGGGAGAAALGAFSAGAFGATAGATGAAAAAVAGSSLAAGGISGAAAGSTAALAGGAAALSPLAATGIGALIAIPAILALSGLFGKKKNVGPFASYAAVMNSDGSLDFKGGGEKNGGSMAQMQEATQSFASAIKQAARVLGIYKTPAIDIGVGSNKQYGTFFGTAGSEAGAVYFGQDPGVAAAAYLRRSFQGTLPDYGSTIGASTEAAKIFARTTGDVQSDLEFVAVYQSLDEAASAASAVSMALDELNAKFDDYAEKARAYGLEVERIEEARQKAIEASVASFLQPLGQRLSGISGLVGSLTIGSASPLSAQQQLDAASTQFSDLSTAALGGDASAQSALGDAGRAYLDVARGFFGTTESYGAVFRDVLGQLGDVVKSVRDTDPTVRAIVETGERGTAAVTKMLGKLIDSVDSLSSEVRRSNDMPVRIGS